MKLSYRLADMSTACRNLILHTVTQLQSKVARYLAIIATVCMHVYIHCVSYIRIAIVILVL